MKKLLALMLMGMTIQGYASTLEPSEIFQMTQSASEVHKYLESDPNADPDLKNQSAFVFQTLSELSSKNPDKPLEIDRNLFAKLENYVLNTVNYLLQSQDYKTPIFDKARLVHLKLIDMLNGTNPSVSANIRQKMQTGSRFSVSASPECRYHKTFPSATIQNLRMPNFGIPDLSQLDKGQLRKIVENEKHNIKISVYSELQNIRLNRKSASKVFENLQFYFNELLPYYIKSVLKSSNKNTNDILTLMMGEISNTAKDLQDLTNAAMQAWNNGDMERYDEIMNQVDVLEVDE